MRPVSSDSQSQPARQTLAARPRAATSSIAAEGPGRGRELSRAELDARWCGAPAWGLSLQAADSRVSSPAVFRGAEGEETPACIEVGGTPASGLTGLPAEARGPASSYLWVHLGALWSPAQLLQTWGNRHLLPLVQDGS